MLEVNGTGVLKSDDLRPFLAGRLRRMTLGILPSKAISMNGPVKRIEHKGLGWSRVHKAKSLHDKVGLILITYREFSVIYFMH